MNVKHINTTQTLAPKTWQIKLGDADTIDRLDLAFQYQVKTLINKNGQKQS